MPPKVTGQERAFAEKQKSDLMSVLVFVFFWVSDTWEPNKTCFIFIHILLHVFHELQLQDAAGLQPAFLLPNWVLFPGIRAVMLAQQTATLLPSQVSRSLGI